MTTIIARPPLQELSMSSLQSGSRRQSARIQQKEDNPPPTQQAPTNGASSSVNSVPKAQLSTSNARKRKNNYDEEDDGFVFSRVKKKKPRQSTAAQTEPSPAVTALSQPTAEPASQKPTQTATSVASEPKRHEQHDAVQVPIHEEGAAAAPQQKKRKRMSFSTPAPKKKTVRRSKRLSAEINDEQGSPVFESREDLKSAKVRQGKPTLDKTTAKPPPKTTETQPTSAAENLQDDNDHSSTKIALPFADTPVISRNKAMREGKSSKGDRRSSLGLRGRRASSLIDSGASNAQPHTEVGIDDFYKHIEGDLIEPRRMRQLLTWCATRAMHAKPQGTGFEETSAKSAARVIEEELLKDLINKPYLSDWFSREEEVSGPAAPLPERPNPKNVQNTEKIAELEEQIKRLKTERDALEALLEPVPMLEPQSFEQDQEDIDHIDTNYLSPEERQTLEYLQHNTSFIPDMTEQLQSLVSSLEPSIDMFADGVHKITQYQNQADRAAGQVLSICAEKLADRDRQGRQKALGIEEARSPARDLNSVLRGLGKIAR